LHEIKVAKGETLTDEFVANLKREGVSTVEELRASIKKEIETRKETSETDRIVGTAVKFACDNATVDIPQEMLDQEVKNMS
ncbi:MAG: trigger factor, partial [Tenericutes bacterium HGW-Tenericutes-8]